MLKSPLRYPGGKSRAIQQIRYLLPKDFREYREPFVGGGSFFIYLRQTCPEISIWINDLNPELYFFWKYVQKDSEKLASEIFKVKLERKDGQELFDELVNRNSESLSELERAVRFFVLNRITFSGVVESGGYSRLAFLGRFTESSIRRVARLGKLLEGVRITCLDYRELLHDGEKEVFIFLDPPYFKATKSKLYGKNGILHLNFDHSEFAGEMKKCNHSWLITYDDSPEIRKNFDFANIYEWQLQYGMNNYKQGRAEKGSELFISNYELPIEQIVQKKIEQLRLI
ncbi:DNA adenine methylase [Chloracidobacterium aggregatum]|uniref:site-specific DNA-methyltransferase (adenine-specific) n=1 Tax=Chloracidobacterium sp. N TaxID=2821540 RepID=A0ABX8B2V5_9BACT|nr:DNA adenine methylase [Chloracidobacterium aggregatum]QUV85763.1 DNA adenine methylase [Chloracidobacterium sp. 2]QUV88845.1 DNA adenine methylase [Chloracidobacterium sp. S]QUV91905.1 DNA adenine methylase [Chloracidobacterium sp. A]QUV94937.1 DNA adenine methylase [Chloracidobacterium sp. N]QUV97997.1 DNA adenine methylase [Chloracidobacterium sp. E]